MNNREIIGSYKRDLQSYSIEQLRYISAENVWSLGQMYDHLVLAALDYLDQVEACASASEEQPDGKTDAGQKVFSAGAFPSVKIKLPDGPENCPDNSRSIKDLSDSFDRVLQRMSYWEKRVPEVNPNYKVRHGGFGYLNAEEWLGLVGMHFRHHLRQKRELEQKYYSFRK